MKRWTHIIASSIIACVLCGASATPAWSNTVSTQETVTTDSVIDNTTFEKEKSSPDATDSTVALDNTNTPAISETVDTAESADITEAPQNSGDQNISKKENSSNQGIEESITSAIQPSTNSWIPSLDEVNTYGMPDYTEMYGLQRDEGLQKLGTTKGATSRRSRRSTQTQNYIYLGILIEFPDENMQNIHLDSDNALKALDIIGHGNGTVIAADGTRHPVVSMSDYFRQQSYNKINMNMQLFPRNAQGKAYSYISQRPRTYYMPRSASNPDGYDTSTQVDRIMRERELLEEALRAALPSIEQTYDKDALDVNGDQRIDSLNFFVESKGYRENMMNNEVGWSDLLWSHNVNLPLRVPIQTLSVPQYTFNNAFNPTQVGSLMNYAVENGTVVLRNAAYSTLIHESLHAFGLPDYYRNPANPGTPVGGYDIMAQNHPAIPQPLLAYNSRTRLHWADPIPEAERGQPITLHRAQFQEVGERNAVKIVSPLRDDEYFVVEYYHRRGIFPDAGNTSGAIVYRINTNVTDGNIRGSQSAPNREELFIFRPGETALGEGNERGLLRAPLSTVGQSLGKALDDASLAKPWDSQTLYYADGSNSGVVLNVTGVETGSITLSFTLPELIGRGTKTDPYIIDSAETWHRYTQGSNNGKTVYAKVTADIDFAGYDYAPYTTVESLVLDGQNHVLSNISIQQDADNSGVFGRLMQSTVKNLHFTNVEVSGAAGFHAGSIAGEILGTQLENIEVLNSNVTGNIGSSANVYQGVGGLVGTMDSSSVLLHNRVQVNVQTGKNLGGLVGLVQGGVVQGNAVWGSVQRAQGSSVGTVFGRDYEMYGAQYRAQYRNNIFRVEDLRHTSATDTKRTPLQGACGVYAVPLTGRLAIRQDSKSALRTMTYCAAGDSVNFSNVMVENNMATVSEENGSYTLTGENAGTGFINFEAYTTDDAYDVHMPLRAPLEVLAVTYAYTVVYCQENLTDSNCTVVEQTQLSAQKGSAVTLPIRNYNGFTLDEHAQTENVKITENNQVFTLVYKRKLIELSFVGEQGSRAFATKLSVKYGSTIRLPDPGEREGYVFSHWEGSSYQPGDEYVVTGPHTFTAVWTERKPMVAQLPQTGGSMLWIIMLIFAGSAVYAVKSRKAVHYAR